MNQTERNLKLIKGIKTVLAANIIGAGFNIILNFLLPKYLSIDTYASIKTYQLYVTYVGILHFGYIDGVYLEYGGQALKCIPPKDLSLRVNSLRWLECFVALICLCVALFLNNNIFTFFCISIPMLNISGLFQLLYQATGEYSRYSKILNYRTILNTIMCIVVLAFISRTDYRFFLLGYVFVDLFLWLWMESQLYKNETSGVSLISFSVPLIIQEIKSGIILRISILSGFLLSGMDRIYVKILLSTSDFAYYSFAATIENLLNIMITPVTTTMYNYFCNTTEKTEIRKTKNLVLIISAGIMIIYFPVKAIISVYLSHYTNALYVLAFLFSAKRLYMIIQGVYVNLYKARRMQNIYLKRLFTVVAIGLITNCVFFFLYRKKESFAMATLVTTIVWLILSNKDFKEISFSGKDYLYIYGTTLLFLIISMTLNACAGGFIYLTGIIILSFICLPDEARKTVFLLKNNLHIERKR